jgi:hypothetical protein
MERDYELRQVHPDRGTLQETWIVFVEWEERRIDLAARGKSTCHIANQISLSSALWIAIRGRDTRTYLFLFF